MEAAAFDQPRLLHARSEYGYTHQPGQAMQHEPEAVGADDQRRLTGDAADRDKERQRIVWRASRARMRAELDYLHDQPFGRRVQSDLRVLERWIARMDARLT